MQVAVIQHDIVWENPTANHEALRAPIAAAAEDGARLIALSETFSWGFTMNTDVAREAPDGPSTQFLLEQAAQTGAWVVGSIPVLAAGMDKPHNRMTFAGPGGELHTYNKLHPFTYGGEADAYQAGAERVTITIEGVRISPFVCFDVRFADDWWALAEQTDCYLLIANWPAARRQHWINLAMARAIENQAYVVAANRVGDAPYGGHAGDSRIIDPFGELLGELGNEAGTLTGDIDPERVAQVRRDYPFLADRKA